jgi:hypothetical protein
MWGFESWQHSSRPGTIATSPEADRAAQPEPETEIVSGLLQLDIKPRDAQIFVNGEFVGTVEDLDGRLELPEGVHRIEIRAARYEAHAFDARIVAARTITYRVTLSPLSSPLPPLTPAPSATRSGQGQPARPAQTFYLIPGCYLGNVPPEQVKLPPDCDMSRMITHTPGK